MITDWVQRKNMLFFFSDPRSRRDPCVHEHADCNAKVSRNLSIKPKETWSSVTITTQGSAAPIFTFTHFRKNLVSPASIDIE